MALNLNDLTYPFDPTGGLASNLITGEQQILTPVNWTDYQFIVPNWAPFFADSVVATITNTQGTVTPLVLGVDWYPCFEFISASRACADPIWGGIQFINPLLSGVVTIQYQTLGGIWTLDTTTIAQLLADRTANPRVTAWEQVVTLPVAFPVIDHEWDLVDLVGASDIVTAIGNVEAALRQTGSTGLAAHLADFTNPHRVTAAQVGLGNVQNYGIAQAADLAAGTSNTLYMTPAGVTAMISSTTGSALAEHEADYNNPHQVTAAQIGAYTSAQVDQLLSAYVPTNGAATNSLEFNGMDAPTYRDWALSTGIATNSQQFNGMTPAQFATWLGSNFTATNATNAANSLEFNGMDANDYANWVMANYTASNSNELGGYTLAQIQSDLNTQVAQLLQSNNAITPQSQYDSAPGESDTDYWQEIGQMIMPSSSYPASGIVDAHWILSGANSNGEAVGTCYYLHVSNTQTNPVIEVVALTPEDVGATFGYTVEDVVQSSQDNASVSTMRIWMHTGPLTSPTSLVRLNQDSAILIAGNRVSTAPANIIYSTNDRFALESEVTTVLDNLTTAFTALAAQINT